MLQEKEIDALVDCINGKYTDDHFAAVRKLRAELSSGVADTLLKRFGTQKKWKIRAAYADIVAPESRESEAAVELGLLAIQDQAYGVRLSGCAVVAYSSRKDLIPRLLELKPAVPRDSLPDLEAVIDAIKHQNHNYFMDREHTGKVTWNP